MKRKKRYPGSIVFALVFFISAFCLGNDIQKLLPSSSDVFPFKPQGKLLRFKEEGLYDFIDGGAEIYFEYGFTEALSQEYTDGKLTISITIYLMKDEEAAFGIYSANRKVGKKRIKIGGEGVVSDFMLLFWQERFYVVIETFNPGARAKKEMIRMARLVSRKIGRIGAPPSILARLPKGNLIPGSEVFVRGTLGINNQFFFSEKDPFRLKKMGGEGAFADYRFPDGDRFKLFLVRYSRKEDVFLALSRLEAIWRKQGFVKEQKNKIAFWRYRAGYYLVKKSGNFLSIVLGARNKENGLKIINLCP